MKNINRSFYLLLVLAATSFCISCGSKVNESEEAKNEEDANIVEITQAQYKTAGIELGKAEDRQISGTVRASGVLDVPPQQLVSISIPLGGFLKSTELLQGFRVKKGQIIATLEYSRRYNDKPMLDCSIDNRRVHAMKKVHHSVGEISLVSSVLTQAKS